MTAKFLCSVRSEGGQSFENRVKEELKNFKDPRVIIECSPCGHDYVFIYENVKEPLERGYSL